MVILVKFVHPIKQCHPISFKLFGKITSDIFVLFSNTPPAIQVTFSGIVTLLFSPLYLIKTLFPFITNSSDKLVYHGTFWKLYPILVTPSFILISVIFLQLLNAPS